MSEPTSARPRRTLRGAPTKVPVAATTPSSSSSKLKRKAEDSNHDVSSANQLDYLLTNSKSKLTTMSISVILNYDNFVSLPQDAQERLCQLLPPAAFSSFRPLLDPTHPARRGDLLSIPCSEADAIAANMVADKTPAILNPTIFSSSPFVAAATTFQDHLYSSWLTAPARSKVETFKTEVQKGTLHAEWKDDTWRQEAAADTRNTSQSHDRDLAYLAKRSSIKEGDVLVYSRTFHVLGHTVEKELLVRSINPMSHTLNLLLQPATMKELPRELLAFGAPEPTPPTLTMEEVFNSVELEDAVLAVDGRVSRPDVLRDIQASTNTNSSSSAVFSIRAAKSITVWRWQEDVANDIELQLLQSRGGRELIATVYFLRNA